MNPLIQLKKQLHHFSSHWRSSALGFRQKRKQSFRRRTAAIPEATPPKGKAALLSLTTGAYNTAVGLFSLRSDTTGSFNTAIGAGTLLANTSRPKYGRLARPLF